MWYVTEQVHASITRAPAVEVIDAVKLLQVLTHAQAFTTDAPGAAMKHPVTICRPIDKSRIGLHEIERGHTHGSMVHHLAGAGLTPSQRLSDLLSSAYRVLLLGFKDV